MHFVCIINKTVNINWSAGVGLLLPKVYILLAPGAKVKGMWDYSDSCTPIHPHLHEIMFFKHQKQYNSQRNLGLGLRLQIEVKNAKMRL